MIFSLFIFIILLVKDSYPTCICEPHEFYNQLPQNIILTYLASVDHSFRKTFNTIENSYV